MVDVDALGVHVNRNDENDDSARGHDNDGDNW